MAVSELFVFQVRRVPKVSGFEVVASCHIRPDRAQSEALYLNAAERNAMAKTPLRLIVLARDQSSRVQDAWREMSEFLEHEPGAKVVAAAVTEDLVLDD